MWLMPQKIIKKIFKNNYLMDIPTANPAAGHVMAEEGLPA